MSSKDVSKGQASETFTLCVPYVYLQFSLSQSAVELNERQAEVGSLTLHVWVTGEI